MDVRKYYNFKKLLTKETLGSIIIFVKHRGVEQLAARRAHNPKVVSSSLTPATTEMPLLKQFTEDFLLLGKIHLRPLKTVKKH